MKFKDIIEKTVWPKYNIAWAGHFMNMPLMYDDCKKVWNYLKTKKTEPIIRIIVYKD